MQAGEWHERNKETYEMTQGVIIEMGVLGCRAKRRGGGRRGTRNNFEGTLD